MIWVGGEGVSSEARERCGQEVANALWQKTRREVEVSIDIGPDQDNHKFKTIERVLS